MYCPLSVIILDSLCADLHKWAQGHKASDSHIDAKLDTAI